MAYVFEQFQSQVEVEDYILSTQPCSAARNARYTEDFNGCKSASDAIRKAAAGYREIVSRCSDGIDKTIRSNGIGVTNRSVRARAISGSTPNVTRAMLGLPDSMIRYKKGSAETPVFRLAYDISKLSSISHDDCIQWGINCMSIVKAADMRGLPIELWVVMATDGLRVDGETAVCEICIKRAGHPLNISSAAFWLAHPAAQRGIGFALRERMIGLYDKFDTSYGRSHSSTRRNRASLRDWYRLRGYTYIAGYDFEHSSLFDICEKVFD